MNCERIRDYFIDYIDGSLNTEEKQMVESHLKDCKECSEELVMLRDLVSDLSKDREEIQIPESFMNNLKERVNDTQFGGRRKIKPLRTLLIAAVILTMSVATVFAAKEPIMELIKLVNPQKRIDTLVDKGMGHRLNISKVDKDIKITVKEVLADDAQTVISYKIEDLKDGKEYSAGYYFEDVTVKEKWGISGEAADTEMIVSASNFKGEGTLTLSPIDTSEKTIHLTFNKLRETADTKSNIIEGNWSFELPIKKYAGKSYELNSTVKIDNYTITFDKLTISPTMTKLSYKLLGGKIEGNQLTKKIIGLEDLIITSGGKQYKSYEFAQVQMSPPNSIEYGNNEMRFESMYFDNPKELEIHIKRINTQTYEDKPVEYNIRLDSGERQEFDYRGTKIAIENLMVQEDITFDIVQSSDYANSKFAWFEFRPQGEWGADRHFSTVGNYEGLYYLDKDNKKYQYMDALLLWDKLRDKNPVLVIEKTKCILHPKGNLDIKNEKSFKMIVDTYQETIFIDGTAKLTLK
jgi:hypothetical protein